MKIIIRHSLSVIVLTVIALRIYLHDPQPQYSGKKEVPGLKEVNAVDAAGVHPLLLAVGSERYTPFNPTKIPQELLTIAHHILGTGQMSLAKYLFICDEHNNIDIKNEKLYFTHFFERVNWQRDMHFQTKTTIDTLDYSGEGLNEGSKVIIAAAGETKRKLAKSLPKFDLPSGFSDPFLVSDGNLVIQSNHGIIEDLIKTLENFRNDFTKPDHLCVGKYCDNKSSFLSYQFNLRERIMKNMNKSSSQILDYFRINSRQNIEFHLQETNLPHSDTFKGALSAPAKFVCVCVRACVGGCLVVSCPLGNAQLYDLSFIFGFLY